eukprot:2736658-Pyramimonas_sp.AAC.1
MAPDSPAGAVRCGPPDRAGARGCWPANGRGRARGFANPHKLDSRGTPSGSARCEGSGAGVHGRVRPHVAPARLVCVACALGCNFASDLSSVVPVTAAAKAADRTPHSRTQFARCGRRRRR